MSQNLVPISDTAGNAAAGSYAVLASGSGISCLSSWDGSIAQVAGAWGGDVGIPPNIPNDGDVQFNVSVGYTGGDTSAPGTEYSIMVTHPFYGSIPELSTMGLIGNIFPPIAGGGPDIINIHMTNAQFISAGYDLTLFFSSSLNVLIGSGWTASPGSPWTGSFGISSWNLEVSDGGNAAIVGSGGILVGGAAVTPYYVPTGGVVVGSGGTTTPMVLSTDPSGMYTLVDRQRFDRVYTRNTAANDTTDVAIPTPFAKTGYFGA